MEPSADEELKDYIEQFLKDSQMQADFYQHAAAYLAARRVIRDLEATNEPRISRKSGRLIHPSELVNRLVNRVLQTSGFNTGATNDKRPDYVEGVVISRSYGNSDPTSTEGTDHPPIVIIIPPRGSEDFDDLPGTKRR